MQRIAHKLGLLPNRHAPLRVSVLSVRQLLRQRLAARGSVLRLHPVFDPFVSARLFSRMLYWIDRILVFGSHFAYVYFHADDIPVIRPHVPAGLASFKPRQHPGSRRLFTLQVPGLFSRRHFPRQNRRSRNVPRPLGPHRLGKFLHDPLASPLVARHQTLQRLRRINRNIPVAEHCLLPTAYCLLQHAPFIPKSLPDICQKLVDSRYVVSS